MQTLEISEEKRQEIYEEHRQRREKFIEENTIEWVKKGEKIKRVRLAYGVTLAKMARLTGFSATKLANFETGRPVLNRTVIERSYELVLQLADLEIQAVREKTPSYRSLKS
jgi:DNA-binding transcriptional regulator YiaG